MCLILDPNRFGDVLSTPTKAAYRPLLDWLTSPKRNGALVYGGTKYTRGIGRHAAARDFFVQRSRAGRAFLLDETAVDAAEDRLRVAKACRSDDEHIIALAQLQARASSARKTKP